MMLRAQDSAEKGLNAIKVENEDVRIAKYEMEMTGNVNTSESKKEDMKDH